MGRVTTANVSYETEIAYLLGRGVTAAKMTNLQAARDLMSKYPKEVSDHAWGKRIGEMFGTWPSQN